jgi:hypothetical protein
VGVGSIQVRLRSRRARGCLSEIAAGGGEFFVPWLVYHYPLDGLPPFEWYARENDSLLSRRERDWIEAQRRSWMSVWEVRESVPGKSMCWPIF